MIGGDNYAAEQLEQFEKGIKEELKTFKPDVLVAGPTFDLGRYGLTCAQVCIAAKAGGIPAVTGMHPDNPGVMIYRRNIIAVPSGIALTEMQLVLEKMARLAFKMGNGEKLG